MKRFGITLLYGIIAYLVVFLAFHNWKSGLIFGIVTVVYVAIQSKLFPPSKRDDLRPWYGISLVLFLVVAFVVGFILHHLFPSLF